ncbi:alpha/beta fold hydrolase [Mycolicibacterium sp. P1-18]|uniref:alpha/beta hydrolase n=1 Tax=Mycolicibacterium sp. P1-18 TaxID=2024615 RepID=UPI0011F1D74D|nr:alpha/beta fold hydrolase [Mycolicibacterium sp. P1-18]KAA0098686.1 alpha/beta fold hydrolase [Mycolicibacterium sp. P1-18]
MTATPDVTFTYAEAHFYSDGTRCAARVYRSRAAGAEAPVVVMAHGLGGVRAMRLFAYAERFAAAGYAVVVFDYRGFGDSDGEPRQVLDIAAQQADWRAALGFARRLPGVDAARVVAWGTSLAGGHVITLAGTGVRLAAVIAQVPHISGPAAVRATGVLAGLRLTPSAVRDQLRAWRHRTPVYVDAAGAPGSTAVMTSPDALPGMRRLVAESGPEAATVPQFVAARVALRIGLYSPGRHARGVTCPVLMQVAEHDAVTPPRVALKAARAMARPTVQTYDCGHFDPYVEPFFATVVADQLAFLATHVPVGHSR